jgi:p-hydroxybenzoate 3-monooxygenase
MLAHLLHLQGIESVVLESHTRDHVENRVRAGVLEQGTVDMLRQSGVGAQNAARGTATSRDRVTLRWRGHRINFQELVGKSITVYAQQEVVKDLIAARLGYGAPIFFKRRRCVCRISMRNRKFVI